ncbi:MAG: sensor histidine kinase [Oscillospiraceae bacterium]
MFNPVQKLLNTKFRNKLIIMCITAVVPVTLAGVFLLYNLADTIKENAINETISASDSLKTRLKDVLVTVSNISERVIGNEKVQELINNDFVNRDEYYDYYLQNKVVPEFLNAYSQIDDIKFYIDIENFVPDSSFCYADEKIKDTYWYRETAETNSVKWQLVYDEIDGAETYFLCQVSPLNGRDGSFLGVMRVTVSSDIYTELVKEYNFSAAMCVGQGVIFYSNVPDYDAGMVVNDMGDGFLSGISDSKLLKDGKNQLEKLGTTVVSYFDFDNSGNLFQIYVVKPYAFFDDEIKGVIFVYIWYIFLCILLSILITILFSSVFSRRIQFLKNQMHSVSEGNFELTDEIKGTDEIFDLYQDLKKMVDSMQTLINDAYKAKIQSESFKLNQVEAEFKALASQINPHFLYNTLETIRMKAYCNNDKETADLVKKLGKFMRRCLEVKDGMVTLESELEFTKSYLELQSARFGDRVSYSIYCEVDRNYKILPLIIQPIVENAFVHGIESAKNNGKINVKVFYRGETVLIEVSDNGSGIAPDKLRELLAKLEKNDTSSGKSIGLTNVNKRIKMYHGEQYGMTVETVPGRGTTIRITLPREVDENVMKRLPEKYREISGNISAKLNS